MFSFFLLVKHSVKCCSGQKSPSLFPTCLLWFESPSLFLSLAAEEPVSWWHRRSLVGRPVAPALAHGTLPLSLAFRILDVPMASPPLRLPRLPTTAPTRRCPGDAPLFTRRSRSHASVVERSSAASRNVSATHSATAEAAAVILSPTRPAMDTAEARKMTTEVRTLPARKPKFRAARPNDYLYDPAYVLAGPKDFQRCGQRAQQAQRELELRPNFRSMFSDHPRYPRLEYTVRCPGFTPAMHGTWEAKRQQVLLQSMPPGRGPCTLPCGGAMGAMHDVDRRDVRGMHRHLFFRRPVAPMLSPVMPLQRIGAASVASTAASSAATGRVWPCVQATAIRSPCPALIPCEEVARGGRGPCVPRHKSTQTDYREQETQTSPWQPAHSVRIGESPEVLTLAALSWGNGLPAGILEVELIERMRVRRAWERALTVPRNEEEHECFERAIARLDRDEWAQREREIEAAQCERLRIANRLLEQCRALAKRRCEGRLKRAWARGERVRDRKIATIRRQRERDLRKLANAHLGISRRYKRLPVIEEHTDVTSQLYGPLARFGVDPRNRHEIINMPCDPHQRLRALDLLEREPPIPEPAFDYNAQSKIQKKYILCPRESRWNEQTLEALLQELRQMREPPRSGTMGLIRRIYKESTPPATPTLDSVSDSEERLYQATVFLQKIIKGRAVQCLMFQGLRRCRELIGELKTTHGLSEESMKEARKMGKHVVGIQRDEYLYDVEEKRLMGLAMQLQGTTVSMMLDFLNKELVRLQQERLAHAFALLAERSRQDREAMEAGRRQTEERRRREHDEMWRQVVKVHQDAIDTYLEDVILHTMERTADDEARRYVQRMVQQMDQAAAEANDREDAIEQEELVADLLHSFLLPEVEKQLLRERHLAKQKRLLLAAHDQVYGRLLRPKEGEPETRIPKEPPPLSYFPESKWKEPIPEKASVEKRLSQVPSDHMCWERGPPSPSALSETEITETPWPGESQESVRKTAEKLWTGGDVTADEEDATIRAVMDLGTEGEEEGDELGSFHFPRYRRESVGEEEEEDHVDVEKTFDAVEAMLRKARQKDSLGETDDEETLAAAHQLIQTSSESDESPSEDEKDSQKRITFQKSSSSDERESKKGDSSGDEATKKEDKKKADEADQKGSDEKILEKMDEVKKAFDDVPDQEEKTEDDDDDDMTAPSGDHTTDDDDDDDD